MDEEKLYDIAYAKQKLKNDMESGSEPEICITLKGNTYMIIPLRDKISFHWIGKTKEFYFSSVEELFCNELINGIMLDRDWKDIEDIYYY